MGKLALLFAGQGAQKPGMGKSLCEENAAAEKVFAGAEAVRPGTRQDCFEADEGRLARTDVTQPCVFTVDLAAAEALRAAGIKAEGVAGFSLGELAALTYAGAFTLQEGLELVCRRGLLMQKASEENPGAMVAVLKLPDEKVEELAAGFSQVYPVNYNCEGQVVVAGAEGEIPAFCAAVKEAGGAPRPLAVGGAFHSPFMQAPAAEFEKALMAVGMELPAVPVYSNVTGHAYAPPLCEKLAAQMKSPVRWSSIIRQMAQDGFDTFIEVGPGKTLTGFAKRIVPGATLYNAQDAESLAAVVAALA